MERDYESKHMCYDCTSDHTLADEVKNKGVPIECSYCGHTREAIELGELADRIHNVIQEHF